MSLPSAQPAPDSPDVAPAGTGTVDTGAVAVLRRTTAADRHDEYADFELVDGDGHVFGHTYRTADGYAGGDWASHGPAAFSPGHPTLQAAEDVQIIAYISDALPVTYLVEVDPTGNYSGWEPVFAGETRVQSPSPIDASVRAREIEAVYRTARAPGSVYRITVTVTDGREITAYTPDLTERGVPDGIRL